MSSKPYEQSEGSKTREIATQLPGASALYEDRKKLRRYLVGFTLVTAAVSTLWGSMPSILLPNHIQGIEFAHFFTGSDAHVNLQKLTQLRDAVAAGTASASAHQNQLLDQLVQFETARATALATVIAISTIATLILLPLVGVFSDRTKSRFGRRAPWMLYGAIFGALALVGLRFSVNIALIAVFWALVQVLFNTVLTPLLATAADRVPENRIGTASSLGGAGNVAGALVGAILVGALYATVGLNFYVIWGLLGVLAVVVFIVRNPDSSSLALQVPKFSMGQFLRGFLIPLRARDFRWVWIARVLIIFGYSVSTALGFFMLQSYVRPGLSAAEATSLSPIVALAGIPFTITAVVLAGRISDRIGRRKPFVIAASILMSASMIVPIISPTLPAIFAQAIMASLAFGIFIPVDQALFIDVLPDPTSFGRDLGIAGAATLLGQALGPVLAAQVLAITGGYEFVWVTAFVLSAVAAVAILPVKGAR